MGCLRFRSGVGLCLLGCCLLLVFLWKQPCCSLCLFLTKSHLKLFNFALVLSFEFLKLLLEVLFQLVGHVHFQLRPDLLPQPCFQSLLLILDFHPVCFVEIRNFLFNFFKFCLPEVFFILQPLFELLVSLLLRKPRFFQWIVLNLGSEHIHLVFMFRIELLLFSIPITFGSGHIVFDCVDCVFHVSSCFVLGHFSILLALLLRCFYFLFILEVLPL